MSADNIKPTDGGPTIDSLLKNANWEDRVAEARAKREIVLAAKRAASEAEAPAKPTAPVVPAARPKRPRSVDAPPAPRRGLGTLVTILVVVACSAAAGALVLWLLIR